MPEPDAFGDKVKMCWGVPTTLQELSFLAINNTLFSFNLTYTYTGQATPGCGRRRAAHNGKGVARAGCM